MKKRGGNTQAWHLNFHRNGKCISTTNETSQEVKSANGWQGNTTLNNWSSWNIPFLGNFRKTKVWTSYICDFGTDARAEVVLDFPDFLQESQLKIQLLKHRSNNGDPGNQGSLYSTILKLLHPVLPAWWCKITARRKEKQRNVQLMRILSFLLPDTSLFDDKSVFGGKKWISQAVRTVVHLWRDCTHEFQSVMFR